MSFVYLLHFDEPYPGGRRPRHYIGVARDVPERVAEHRRGNPGKGGALMRALHAEGIGFEVAHVWTAATSDAAFELERRLKASHKHSRHCPLCRISPA